MTPMQWRQRPPFPRTTFAYTNLNSAQKSGPLFITLSMLGNWFRILKRPAKLLKGFAFSLQWNIVIQDKESSDWDSMLMLFYSYSKNCFYSTEKSDGKFCCGYFSSWGILIFAQRNKRRYNDLPSLATVSERKNSILLNSFRSNPKSEQRFQSEWTGGRTKDYNSFYSL